MLAIEDDLNETARPVIAEVLRRVAKDGLPGPRDLDVALDAILEAVLTALGARD